MGKVSPKERQSKTPKQKRRIPNSSYKYLKPGALAQLRYNKASIAKSCTDLGKKRVVVLDATKTGNDVVLQNNGIHGSPSMLSPERFEFSSVVGAADIFNKNNLLRTPKTPSAEVFEFESRLESLPMDLVSYAVGRALTQKLKELIPRQMFKVPIQGALDGGLDISHSDKIFSGFSKDSKQLDAEVHRKYIYGGHVAAYMKILMEDEPKKYQSHFVEYIKRGIESDGIEELYKKVHAAIYADPTQKKSEKEPPKQHKRYNLKKLTYDERKASLIERLNALNAAEGADEEVDDEDDE